MIHELLWCLAGEAGIACLKEAKVRRTVLALTVGLMASNVAATAADDLTAFRVYTESAGVHEVTFESLGIDPVESDRLSLESQGRLVPMHVRDGGDGEFGPGDAFEFVARIASGPTTYYHPWTRHNVYWLRFDETRARRFTTPGLDSGQAADLTPVQAERRLHLEEDRLLIRLAARDVEDEAHPELWYWAKQTHLSEEPFRVEIDAADAATDYPVTIAFGVRGISASPRSAEAGNQREHSLVMSALDRLLRIERWDGKKPRTTRRMRSALEDVAQDQRIRLEASVAPREIDGQPLVDVVMIDWLELSYGFNGLLRDAQVELHLPADDRRQALHLRSEAAGTVAILGDRTGYVEAEWDADGSLVVPVAPAGQTLWIRPEGSAHRPVHIERDRPSDLRAYARQADYVILAHSSLLSASEELAEFHRRRGLAVDLIDVQDVYDEFGHGLVSPDAIQAFLRHAYYNWQRPRLRWALLVGDASWDTKNSTVDDANYANWVGRQLVGNDRFRAKSTEDYDPEKLNDRGLIPSWNHHTNEGHAASDAYFTLMDDDPLPDIALGRLPAATPDEVRAIATKVRNYAEASPFGPWRSRLTWISGASERHRERSIALAADFAGTGRPATLILPRETARPEDKARIVEALDEGSLVTHFIGHGGRFIWRTGPPDLKHQIDLFGLEDLETLEPNGALSLVVSVSCYSAPFDHPSADSIGEAFLRSPDRGAAAFIGASWRNAPPRLLSESLVRHLSKPGTVGEALLATKREVARPDVTHLFNLLGDPAMPIAAPGHSVEVTHSLSPDGVDIAVVLPDEAVGGRLVLEYLDVDGVPLGSEELAIDSPTVALRRRLEPEVEAVSVYFWNEETRIDGLGATRFERSEDLPAGKD